MEFYLVFSVFYVHLVHIFPPNFSVRRDGIQYVGGLVLPIQVVIVLRLVSPFIILQLQLFIVLVIIDTNQYTPINFKEKYD